MPQVNFLFDNISFYTEANELPGSPELQIEYGVDNYTVIESTQNNESKFRDLPETVPAFAELRNQYFIVDATTSFPEGIVTSEELLAKDLSVEMSDDPQILIFHTHASETYSDSREGAWEDTVVGVGEVLAEHLRDAGYNVIHDKTRYDVEDGVVNRDVSYNNALVGLEENLKKYPSIEVIIDVHRDSGAKRVAQVGGKTTAQVMLFNGLSRNANGPISYLPNENLPGNLAFSLQLKQLGDERYPNFMKRIYLKGYRYNMHLVERALLAEVGTEQNTVEEAKAAMKPFSALLIETLNGES